MLSHNDCHKLAIDTRLSDNVFAISKKRKGLSSLALTLTLILSHLTTAHF